MWSPFDPNAMLLLGTDPSEIKVPIQKMYEESVSRRIAKNTKMAPQLHTLVEYYTAIYIEVNLAKK